MEPHFATIWEAVADAVADRDAVVQGGRRYSWADFDQRSGRFATALSAAGLTADSKVALYLYNSPEYLEAQFGAFKMRGVPVNVNYRYLDDELTYLLENSDSEALVFHRSLGEHVARVAPNVEKLRLLVEVNDTGGEPTTTAVEYEELLAAHDPAPRIVRDPDDIFMLYTGGTTGMPKGVIRAIATHVGSWTEDYPISSADDIPGLVTGLESAGRLATVVIPCPLMHGTGMLIGFIVHGFGGTMVLPESRSLDPEGIWEVTASEPCRRRNRKNH